MLCRREGLPSSAASILRVEEVSPETIVSPRYRDPYRLRGLDVGLASFKLYANNFQLTDAAFLLRPIDVSDVP